MGIEDEYAAFCLDETCLFMIQQAREKREPDFGRPARLEKQKGRQNATTNAEAAEMIRGVQEFGIRTGVIRVAESRNQARSCSAARRA